MKAITNMNITKMLLKIKNSKLNKLKVNMYYLIKLIKNNKYKLMKTTQI